MKAIYKYPLNTNSEIEIEMPVGAQLLTVETQNNEPQMWAIVDTLKNPELRFFRVVLTGDPIGTVDELAYLGSFIIDNGLIYHVFEDLSNAATDQ